MNGASSTGLIALVLGVLFAAAGWLGGRGSDGPADWGPVDWAPSIRAAAIGYDARMDRLTGSVNWVVLDCRKPPPPSPQFSFAGEASPHSRKLYHLWTDDSAGYYRAIGDNDSGVMFALVKEARVPIPVADALEGSTVDLLFNGHTGPGVAVSPDDGKLYTPGAVDALFIMQRVGDADTPQTDQGWIYGVTSPDGREVIQSGLIESCMSCHTKKQGRLFGLRPTNRPYLYQPPEPSRGESPPNG